MRHRSTTVLIAIIIFVAAAVTVRPGATRAEDTPPEPAISTVEELAVLGELVRGALTRVYASTGHVELVHRWIEGLDPQLGHPHGQAAGGGAVGRPHALYLRGHGVVLQIEAPRPRASGAERGIAGAPSEWDLARQRVHGTSFQPSDARNASCLNCHATSGGTLAVAWIPDSNAVRDALVDVVGRNGHNLRSLGAGQRLTVAVTFRDAPATRTTVHPHEGGPFGESLAELEVARDPAALERILERPGSGAPEQLAADLHLRQGNYEEAVAAYTALLEKYTASARPEHVKRTVRRKLAQAYTALGQYERARKLLTLLEQQAGDDSAAKGAPAAAPPISQLVITATREQLDAIAGGRLSPALFREQVEIELRPLDFTASSDPGKDPRAGASAGGAGIEGARMEGVIDAVDDEDGLVVISIGRDRGVKVGQRFSVLRGGDLVGEVEVVKVYDDLAGARTIRIASGREVRVGDRVATATSQSVRSP